MVAKTYLRYRHAATCGIVASPQSNILSWHNGQYAIAGALENVIVWDVRKGTAVVTLTGEKHAVTCMAASPDGVHIAVGYEDGTIRIWKVMENDCVITFSGHKSAVSALSYDVSGMRLASGSNDTHLIVWDVVAETGLYRLRGHKDQITQVRFLSKHNVLVSSSKDTFVRVWDLDIQHCVQTVVGHRSEVLAFVINADETRMISGTMDPEFKLWSIGEPPADRQADGDTELDLPEGKSIAPVHFGLLGSIPRQGKERVVTMGLNADGSLLACQGADKTVEMYHVRSDEEVKKKLKRRAKRLKEKARAHSNDEAAAEVAERKASDELEHVHTIRLSAKARSFDWASYRPAALGQHPTDADSKAVAEAQLLIALTNNVIETHVVKIGDKSASSSVGAAVDMPGHRSGIRAMAMSTDDKMLVTCSTNSVKVWNMATRSCIRTMPSGYGLCVAFVPGNRHVLVGTKTGEIQLFDIGAAVCLQMVKAHEGEVWSISLRPDKRKFASGGADKEVKFWDFDLVEDPEFSESAKRLGFLHTGTLKMSDDVLCVRYSPDQKLLAVSLLDCTVKIFYEDSLKFFTSLYGHKLPVLTMDISQDSTILVTGSADKNIKFWGLDFGDCHRSIFAHSDSIMSVSFVAHTHYVFSVSKDKTIKYWDGDSFEHIATLDGHQAEVWCGVATSKGHFFVSGSHDRSIRMWERTDEQLVLSEEREAEREAEFENMAANDNEREQGVDDGKGEAVSAGKRTVETIKAGEKIIEAMELAEQEKATQREYEEQCAAARHRAEVLGQDEPDLPPKPAPNVIMSYLKIDSPERYVLHVVMGVRANELEEALLIMPFNLSVKLLEYINTWMKNGWETELACRCLFYMLRIHQNQIVSNQVTLHTMDSLRINTRSQIRRFKDTVGFNLAGLRYLKRELETRDVKFFDDQTKVGPKSEPKKKRKIVKS